MKLEKLEKIIIMQFVLAKICDYQLFTRIFVKGSMVAKAKTSSSSSQVIAVPTSSTISIVV
jgi:hypothetical protein